ncbi:MAG: enoyl-CoA hydratase/isomerase family protein [bacterium]|nr:enoyl-CoA hydratase/isomerase family protein [bacterium]
MIHREDRGSVTVLRMEHGKANAVDDELFTDLNRALDDVEGSSARALVLTGTGSMFSAGVNLFKVLEGGGAYVEEFLPVLSSSIRRLFDHPLPIVAAVNGHAIAGGCILAAACDRRVMNSEQGSIGVTELLVGVPFPVDALEVLRFLMPDRHVQSLVYSGRTLSAEEALQIGLVEEVAAGDELLDHACEMANKLGRLAGDAFATTKRLIRRPTLDRMRALSPEIDPDVLEIWSRPETLDGIRTFLDQTVGKK